MSDRDCDHGQLARSCEICDLESRLAAAEERVAQLEGDLAQAAASLEAQEPVGWKQLLDRVVPRIDAGGPNPINEVEHCCEWTLYRERERIHNEFADIAAQQHGGGEDE